MVCKRIIIIIFICLVFLSILTSCSGNNDNNKIYANVVHKESKFMGKFCIIELSSRAHGKGSPLAIVVNCDDKNHFTEINIEQKDHNFIINNLPLNQSKNLIGKYIYLYRYDPGLMASRYYFWVVIESS